MNIGAILATFAGAVAQQATAACELAVTSQYRESAHLVDSLRPDKAGQARVFAADGSEFTAGQVLWMRARMRNVARLCASPVPQDQSTAARVLTQVTALLKSHQRNS